MDVRLAAAGVGAAPCVLMVSGGADSTAMLRLFVAWREARKAAGEGVLPAVVLHVNHQLRGSAADEDAAFVAALADELGLHCVTVNADVAGAAALGQCGGNVEAVGREVRYAAARETLDALCGDLGVSPEEGVVLTAHTADDRVENFYMRSIVGAGPGALRSLDAEAQVKGVRVIRPLLDVTHAELCAWLTAGGHSWQEDATNATDEGFRAYVRHHMVPAAFARNPRIHETLGRTMDLLAEEDDYLQAQADALAASCVQWLAEGTAAGEDACAGEAADAGEDAGTGEGADAGEDAGTDEAAARGFLLSPNFGTAPKVLQRRVVFACLTEVLRADDPDVRVEFASVEAVLGMWDEGGKIRGGAVTNIQGNLAVSANSRGVRVEPMAVFRARRKKA